MGSFAQENKNQDQKFTFRDYEEMSFEQVIVHEKRQLCNYYLAVLLERHLILSIFFRKSLLKPKFLTFILLFFSMSLDFSLNAIFYSDGYISDRYHEPSENESYGYTLMNELPKSIWSLLISSVITCLL